VQQEQQQSVSKRNRPSSANQELRVAQLSCTSSPSLPAMWRASIPLLRTAARPNAGRWPIGHIKPPPFTASISTSATSAPASAPASAPSPSPASDVPSTSTSQPKLTQHNGSNTPKHKHNTNYYTKHRPHAKQHKPSDSTQSSTPHHQRRQHQHNAHHKQPHHTTATSDTAPKPPRPIAATSFPPSPPPSSKPKKTGRSWRAKTPRAGEAVATPFGRYQVPSVGIVYRVQKDLAPLRRFPMRELYLPPASMALLPPEPLPECGTLHTHTHTHTHTQRERERELLCIHAWMLISLIDSDRATERSETTSTTTWTASGVVITRSASSTSVAIAEASAFCFGSGLQLFELPRSNPSAPYHCL
jgi:hypothetical protein